MLSANACWHQTCDRGADNPAPFSRLHPVGLRSNFIAALILLGVMKNDAKRMSVAGAQPTDAVPEVHPIGSPLPLYRTIVDAEGHSIALVQRNHFWSRLHTRTLFRKYKLSAGKIFTRF